MPTIDQLSRKAAAEYGDIVPIWDADQGDTRSLSVGQIAEFAGNGIISVTTYGATGDGSTDDTAAIQAAIDANPGKAIYFPQGTYRVSGTISVTAFGTMLYGVPSQRAAYTPYAPGYGSVILQTAANIDTVVFRPSSDSSSSLRGVEIRDMVIAHSTAVVDVATSGAGLRMRRASGYRITRVLVIDAYEPVVIQGGSDGKIEGLGIHTYYGTAVAAETAMLSFRSDLYGASVYQPCYTVEVSNLYINGSKKRRHAVWVASCDGLHFTNSYIAGSAESLIRLRNIYDGGSVGSSDTVAALSFVNCYLDCVTSTPTATLGTKHAVKIEEDGNTNTRIYTVDIGSGCFLGNTDNFLVNATFTKAAGLLSFNGAHLANAIGAISMTASGGASDLQVTGCRIYNITASSGGAIAVSGLREMTLSGTNFLPTAGPCVGMTGTMGRVIITGCDNNSTQNDLANSAAATLVLSGNNSASTNPGSSWRGIRTSNQSVNDPTTLDVYVEGTFTPTIAFGGASVGVVYTTQYGAYTRIGNRVLFDMIVQISAKGTSTGALTINGLPISNASGQSTPVAIFMTNTTSGVADQFAQGLIFAGATSCAVFKFAAGAVSESQFTDADVGSAFRVRLSGHYIV